MWAEEGSLQGRRERLVVLGDYVTIDEDRYGAMLIP
jgi:hypothetical protein